MNDENVPPPPPPPPPPTAPGFPPEGAVPERRSGCLKWGLIGCAGLSVLLIVGLVVLGYKAKGLLGWALSTMERQVVTACTDEVTAEEKKAFEDAVRALSEGARTGKVQPDRIRAFQGRATGAMSDGRVTPEEIRELTAAARGD